MFKRTLYSSQSIVRQLHRHWNVPVWNWQRRQVCEHLQSSTAGGAAPVYDHPCASQTRCCRRAWSVLPIDNVCTWLVPTDRRHSHPRRSPGHQSLFRAISNIFRWMHTTKLSNEDIIPGNVVDERGLRWVNSVADKRERFSENKRMSPLSVANTIWPFPVVAPHEIPGLRVYWTNSNTFLVFFGKKNKKKQNVNKQCLEETHLSPLCLASIAKNSLLFKPSKTFESVSGACFETKYIFNFQIF